ncbi:MAG TPA: hypothetical protein PLO47_03580 [Bacillota bacterium]|nr:hypothetical protein [Bacillota bacterium]
MNNGIEMKVKEIVNNEAYAAVIEKHVPGLTKDPRAKMAMGMVFKSIAPYVGGKLSPDVLAAIDADLKAID